MVLINIVTTTKNGTVNSLQMSCNRLLSFIAFLVIITCVKGEECRPALLWNIDVSPDYVLSWQPSVEEQCEIDHYLVSIRHNVNGTEYEFEVKEQSLKLDFLPACESIRIYVTPVSTDNIQGHGVVVHKTLPLPADADLSIVAIGVTQEEGFILLDWMLNEKWQDCAKHHRVVLIDKYTDVATDRYVQSGSVMINELIPCADYDLQITPMYNVETAGPHLNMGFTAYNAILAPPRLTGLSAGSTSIHLTWSLQAFAENRCQLSNLVIDASPYFKKTYPLSDQTDRSSVPIDITDLQPETLYILNVQVENIAGLSTSVRLAVQTQ